MHFVPTPDPRDRSHSRLGLTIVYFSICRRAAQAFFSPHSSFLLFSPQSGLGQLICKHLSRQPKEFVYELCTKPVSKLIEYSRGWAAEDNAKERINWLFVWETRQEFFYWLCFPLAFILNGLWFELVIRVVIPSEDDDHHEEGTWRLEPGSGPLRQISLDQSEASCRRQGPMRGRDREGDRDNLINSP